MTLEQLRIFVAVAERLNMTQAAGALHLTQSAVSAAIAALEARHAAHLFDRVGRGLALSPTGESFLPEARAVLARAEAAALVLDDLVSLRRGRINLAASQTVAAYWLPPRLARFAMAHPAIELSVRVTNTREVAALMRAGALDFGLVEGPVDDPLLELTPVGEDRLGLYAAPGHPLVGAALTPQALSACFWAMREPGSGTRVTFEAGMRALGHAPESWKVLLELPSNEAVLAAAADSALLTAVSERAAAPFLASGQLRRLALDLPARRFVLVEHRQRRRTHATKALLRHITDTQKPRTV